MDVAALIDEASCQLPPSQALPAFKLLLRIMNNVFDHPAEDKFRKLSKIKLLGQLPPVGCQILAACGFADQGEDLVLAGGHQLESLSQARDLLECLVLSQSDEPSAEGMEESEDPDLAEALRMSMAAGTGVDLPEAKRARAASSTSADQEDSDRVLAENLDKETEERVDIAFERFRAEDVLVDADAVEKINKYCSETGDRYVDPQFPPTDKSIYISADEGKRWECLACKTKSDLPPCPPLPKSQEEAELAEAWFAENVKCQGCSAAPHYLVKVNYFNRPTQWLRPSEHCQGCELMYSHLPGGGKELISRLCPHFLRDSVSNTTVGAPWKLIRSEARPEDVCQGGLGNCWFAGALSVVASCPKLIENLFETKELNPAGAYQLQLCHAGIWRRVLVDDLFPASQSFEGYLDGNSAYYSRGGNLCYLTCARRQIWVPLVEKAAAKLFGCWALLKGGTFGEAMSMFTGFPVQRVQLYIPKEYKRRRAERRAVEAERRTQMLIQGLEVPGMEDSDDDLEDADLQWSKILSASESGYLMGMGCTEEGCEKTKHHIVEEMGLQAPHAYGILEAREIEVGGKMLRMMKIRNPWGEKAPRTWKGDWGKDSDKWTFDLKLELGVVNRSNTLMDDPMSIFWMAFEDVKEYFAAVEVNRVHENWNESRSAVWLSSGVGPGEGIDVTVFRKTQVDIAVWQERHINREGALNAKSTNIDVGFAVLRKRGLGNDGQPEYDLVEYILRSKADEVSAEMIFEGGYVYRIVPVSYALSQETAPRRAVIAVHTKQKVNTEKTALDWRDIAYSVFEGCRKRGKKRPVENSAPGLTCWYMQEEAGLAFVVENTSNAVAALQVDGSDSIGCVSSRGSFDAVVAIPPRSRQVIICLAFALGAARSGAGVQALGLPSDAAGFALSGDGLHEPLSLGPAAGTPPPPPDEAILQQAPPAEPEPLSPGLTAGSSPGEDDEDMLKVAMQMSLEGRQPADAAMEVEEEDGDLAAAMRLSMEASQPAPQQLSVDAKAALTARVKVLFEQYRQSGMPPNQAAAKALADAQQGT